MRRVRSEYEVVHMSPKQPDTTAHHWLDEPVTMRTLLLMGVAWIALDFLYAAGHLAWRLL